MNPNTIILIAFLGCNTLVIGMIVYRKIVQQLTKDWLPAPGKIISSRVAYSSSYNKRNPFPFVNYSYEVNGKTYKYYVVVPGDISTGNPAYADRVVARYPKGKEVTVYYNPKNPEKAYLEQYSTADTREWYMLVGWNILLIIGALVFKLVAGFFPFFK